MGGLAHHSRLWWSVVWLIICLAVVGRTGFFLSDESDEVLRRYFDSSHIDGDGAFALAYVEVFLGSAGVLDGVCGRPSSFSACLSSWLVSARRWLINISLNGKRAWST